MASGGQENNPTTNPEQDIERGPNSDPAPAPVAQQSTPPNVQTPNENYADIPPPEYYEEYYPPPSYHVAAELPSYEEAERAKEGKYPYTPNMNALPPPGIIPPPENHRMGGITLLGFPGDDGSLSSGEIGGMDSEALLGNDFVFFTAFITSFLFNWIGFLLLMCFCHTIAARYGALAGFGLSLTKWTLIVKRSTDMASHDKSWLWWLIMAFGLLICIRAIVQYLHIKRSWASLSNAARERLFFFY